MVPAADTQVADCDFLLSIVPPGEAITVAERFAPHLSASAKKPIVVDCNAVHPKTVARVAEIIAAAGCDFVDAGIIGGPPKEGYNGPTIYASGPQVAEFAALQDYGLKIHVLDERIGAASAVKMSYAGITKGFQALGSAMLLAAARAGTAEVLHAELEKSQPALLAWFARQIPQMYPKAYRWVAEMEEIATFVGDDPAAGAMLGATARTLRAARSRFRRQQDRDRRAGSLFRPRLRMRSRPPNDERSGTRQW